MKLRKPWRAEKKELTEDEEIEQTEKMLKKTRIAVDMNLRIAKLAGANALVKVKEQMLGMVDSEVKQSLLKAKSKGILFTADTFMAKLDKITGAYDFYGKVDITKDEIRQRAEVAIKQMAEDEFVAEKVGENAGLIELAPLMKRKMAEGKSAQEAFTESYKELTSLASFLH